MSDWYAHARWAIEQRCAALDFLTGNEVKQWAEREGIPPEPGHAAWPRAIAQAYADGLLLTTGSAPLHKVFSMNYIFKVRK